MKDAATVDDRTLVERSLIDRDVYGLLISRYEAPLSRYVGRLLGQHGHATEDVLQDIFIKAYVNLRGYDRSRPFAPWIYRIAHNEAMTALRKRRAQPQTIDGEDGKMLLERIGETRDPHHELASLGITRTICACLDGLDRRYREVLVLRFLEDKSYTEIADILALPAGTVATFIRRGLNQLKPALEAAGLGIGSLDP